MKKRRVMDFNWNRIFLIFYVISAFNLCLTYSNEDTSKRKEHGILTEEDFLAHFLIDVIFDSDLVDHLAPKHFVVQWNGSTSEEFKVSLSVIDIDDCYSHESEEIANKTYLVSGNSAVDIPEVMNMIEAGCTYNFTIEDTKRGEIRNINHKIPVCYNGSCNCSKFGSFENVTVSYEGNKNFHVDWIYKDTKYTANSTSRNITITAYKQEDCTKPPKESDIINITHEFISQQSMRVKLDDDVNPICLILNYTKTDICFDLTIKPLRIGEEPTFDYTWILTPILAFLLLIVIVLWYIDKCRGIVKSIFISRLVNRRRRVESVSNFRENVKFICQQHNRLYVESEIAEGLTDTYELPRNRLELLYEIGKGAFGEVYLGKAIINAVERQVAVKTLRPKSSDEEMEDFLAEIDIMKKIGTHPNIVTMLKCCTLKSVPNQQYMMIMEYLPFGDLKHYLVNLRDKWNIRRQGFHSDYGGSGSYITPNGPQTPESPLVKKPPSSTTAQYANIVPSPTSVTANHFTFDLEHVLDHAELQSFALQIARGMAHLERIPITHRDLAARNVLIDERKNLKISDFGLSRPGPYLNKSRDKLPVRWMALESIEDHVYDNKTDVWSFGVVLWEIGTLGAFPYREVEDRAFLYHLRNGNRLPRPEICTDDLYALMMRCWSTDSNLRPSFEELVEELDVKKTRVYIDFAQLNPSYVFPPVKSQAIGEVQKTEKEAKYLECP